MRLVRVRAPQGKAQDVAQIAFASGIDQVSCQRVEVISVDETQTTRDVIDIETSTPKAKRFIDGVVTAPFFDPETFSIAVRQPRAVVGAAHPTDKVTWPLVEPTVDIFEDLWQFSHVTYGFAGRIFIGAVLLAFGIIEYRLLFIIAGLLFIPLLPLMLAIGFGTCTRQW